MAGMLRVYINQGGLEDPALVDHPRRWVYGTAAAQAAHDMLEVAQLEPIRSELPLGPPIMIQMVTLSAAVLLKSLRHSFVTWWSALPTSSRQMRFPLPMSLGLRALPYVRNV
ncbi:hypothetical protein DL93DRAFT_1552540 [Clavulina sp. PMI_390]|nr:hypothetical protein DL93DRAFT_1552540 [Clavulina sp. PMI_390]